ncbi:putative HSP40/DnaJ peptide-binding, DnaJ subfamily A member [Helianthus annuus]|nr:putative HSP40/DnaJ peptide-binding, DnaJ subfamily A member [Helianthus annuus]
MSTYSKILPQILIKFGFILFLSYLSRVIYLLDTKIRGVTVEHTLSLTEALCGFQFVLTHLDNQQLLIKSQPGEVVKLGNSSANF